LKEAKAAALQELGPDLIGKEAKVIIIKEIPNVEKHMQTIYLTHKINYQQ
jgi:hypothetical protein